MTSSWMVVWGTACALGMLGAVAAQAAETAPSEKEADKNTVIEDIVVTGAAVRRLDLNSTSQTGSRLGLSALETPATVDVIGSATMRARGLLSVTEAAESLVGVNSGENPGAPSAFSMRGFTDNQIISLRDGLRFGPASLVTRPQNTFNLERVEILKGPASVLYGEGAVAGTINAVTKKPRLGRELQIDALASYGRYDTYQVGVGIGGSLAENVAYRLDVSRTASDGWVDDTPSNSNNVTGAILWQPADNFETTLSFDYLKDDLPNNWGQPLLPASFATEPITGVIKTNDGRTIDKRMRFTNFNVEDDLSESEQIWARWGFNWQATDNIHVRNDAYYMHADREWRNAEQYIFDPETLLITRDRFFVTHDQEIFGDRMDISIHHSIAGLENTFLIGSEYNQVNFDRTRGFPDGDAVDPFNPVRGSFGPLDGKLSQAVTKTTSIFFEDSLSLTEALRLITGGRYEQIKLTRDDFGFDGVFIPDSSFARKFKPVSWRVGATYEIVSDVMFYGQWSNGKDPVGTELFTVESNENFGLASSKQWEVGVKASLDNGRAEVTVAYFDITRKNLLTQISQEEVSNVGQQQSNGFEIATSAALTDQWQASANVAYVDAKYGEFVDPIFGIAASGNRPPNVAKWTANVWTSVDSIAGLPLEVGGGVRYVGKRYSSVANDVTLNDYILVNAFAAYTFNNARLMVRARNLFDKKYVPWVSPFYTNQVALGSPRTLEASIEFKF